MKRLMRRAVIALENIALQLRVLNDGQGANQCGDRVPSALKYTDGIKRWDVCTREPGHGGDHEGAYGQVWGRCAPGATAQVVEKEGP